MKKIFFSVMFLMLILIQASAYLDPGTGSMIVSGIIGVFATLAYVFKGFFYKIFKSKKSVESQDDDKKE
ncbi:MAG: hypothetical protein OCD02_01110 [Spirochaetaceae bacterium]